MGPEARRSLAVTYDPCSRGVGGPSDRNNSFISSSLDSGARLFVRRRPFIHLRLFRALGPPYLMRHAHVALKPGHWPAAKRNFTEAQQKRVADGRGCGTSTPIPACAGALCGTVVPGKLYRVRATPSMSVRTNTATVLLTASAIRPTTVAQNPEGTYPYTQPPANRRPACRHSTPPKVRGAPGANSKGKGG